MKHGLSLLVRLSLAMLCLVGVAWAEPAFPGAVGFGADTPAGRGGQIIKVTNLNGSGAGSLRAAIETTGARIIVFEVGGVINLDRHGITIRNPYITIAGQTAPSPGITLVRGALSVSTHDVLIQHIAVRPGDAEQPLASGWEPDGISTNAAQNVVIDHCSTTWAVDENLSVSGPRLEGQTSSNVTLSNCIIAEALNNSSHSEGPHSKGSLIHDRCTSIGIIRNLYAHNVDRNPYFKIGTTGVIVNNLIYNPGTRAINLSWVPAEWTGYTPPPEPLVSVVGNVFMHGVNTRTGLPLVRGTIGGAYMEDNVAVDRNGNPVTQLESTVDLLAEKPLWPAGLESLPSGDTVEHIVRYVGSRPADRHPIDQRIIDDFLARGGQVIDSQTAVGGYPNDAPTYRALDVPAENIDAWLHQFALDVETFPVSGPLDVVWVDFLFDGPEDGEQYNPFNTLQEGLAVVGAGGTIKFKPGVGSETGRFAQAVRLEAVGGTVRIGDLSAAEPQPPPPAGTAPRSATREWRAYR